MKRDVDGILYEALLVALVGFCAALTANHFSPKGIRLSRDYFPSASDKPGEVESQIGGLPDSTPDSIEARLRLNNLEIAVLAEVEELFRDPRYEAEQVIFVDARSQRHYAEGHVPGAYRLDHFYPEETLAEVLAAAMSAESIVIYCNGGECEDSEFSAILLRDAGVPGDRLRVYLGGMTEWREQGLPVELGLRGSKMLEEP